MINTNYWSFFKQSEIVSPPPSSAVVFIDEHEDCIDEGWFQFSPIPGTPGDGWEEIPASRHNGVGVLSFADGHAEMKKWLDQSILVPPARIYRFGISTVDPRDVRWMRERMTSKKQ